MKSHWLLAGAVLSVNALPGCTKAPPAGAGLAPPNHSYHAPHGGTIVRLGREEYHLEFVRDPISSRLTAYVLDTESKQAIQIRASSFELIASVDGEKRPLTFVAAPDHAQSEAVGDCSRFESQANWLRTASAFEAELVSLKISNTTFLRQRFSFPQGNEAR
jgi:hypothetical protein